MQQIMQKRLRDINGEVQKAIRDTKCKCTAECNSSLEKSTLQAAYATDLSFSRLQRYNKAQYYEPSNESSKRKKCYSLQSHQCNRFDELAKLEIGMIQLLSLPHQ